MSRNREEPVHRGLRYLFVWIALLVLTAASYLGAQTDMGSFEAVFALGIAAIKVTLVALFFMHLTEARFVTSLIIVFALLWVLILCLGVASDVGWR